MIDGEDNNKEPIENKGRKNPGFYYANEKECQSKFLRSVKFTEKAKKYPDGTYTMSYKPFNSYRVTLRSWIYENKPADNLFSNLNSE